MDFTVFYNVGSSLWKDKRCSQNLFSSRFWLEPGKPEGRRIGSRLSSPVFAPNKTGSLLSPSADQLWPNLSWVPRLKGVNAGLGPTLSASSPEAADPTPYRSFWIAFSKYRFLGTSLVVQWLRFNAGDPGSIPGRGTRSHVLQLRVLML